MFIIEVDTYREARKVLLGGTRPVVAHGMGWPDGDWQRVSEVKAMHGAFFARFLNTRGPNKDFGSDRWTQIDGLELR